MRPKNKETKSQVTTIRNMLKICGIVQNTIINEM